VSLFTIRVFGEIISLENPFVFLIALNIEKVCMARTILVTGGAGFIGSNFVRYILEKDIECKVINLDKLTYAGNIENLKGINSRHTFYKGDIKDKELVNRIFEKENITHLINFAAESHVDRSIMNSQIFTQTNVAGTNVLLDVFNKFFQKSKNKDMVFLQVSTDEVYGSLPADGFFEESTPLSPSSPYSASKASADLMVMAYYKTFGIHAIVTRCSNNYGPLQFPEKLIPLIIINALQDKKLPVYGDGKNIRDWLHVEDHCEALAAVLFRGKSGEVYNIGGNSERENIQPQSLINYVTDRLGHDRRYAINASKIRKELGWKPKHSFEEALSETIKWYCENKAWWKNIISGEYRNYYDKQYSINQYNTLDC